VNEDCYSTACEHADGSTTNIRVHINPEARSSVEGMIVEGLIADSEEMIKRCVWRFIGLKHESNEIKGDEENFTIDRQKVLQLVADLRKIDRAKRKVCRTSDKAKS
jgi:hypothetical protein